MSYSEETGLLDDELAAVEARNRDSAKARVAAHAAFDRLWKSHRLTRMKRQEAYAWLGEVMGLPAPLRHIALLDEAQCRRLIALVKEKLDGGSK